ncbi:hypothetical protein ACQPXM_11535 [Kribbella sp. CA-253562]|uniref:hypothetical protein n=1 Tax=Kribbella sp. CA-253562 TaxID=3239942 RepID=UPI003D8AD6CF
MADRRKAEQVREELADVYLCLLRLADVLDVDLAEALLHKLEAMEIRHPLDPDGRNSSRRSSPWTAGW